MKQNGILSYSTCSFSKRQNEDIVTWLLDKEPNAVVERVPGSEKFPVAPNLPNTDPRLDCKVLRFTPADSQTSGLFVARIRKI